MHQVHLPSLPWSEVKSPTGKFHSFACDVSLALGGVRNGGPWVGGHPFDVQLRRLPPGAAVCPYHAHLAQWELFVVRRGEGTVRAPDGLFAVKTGDVFFHPPGTPHQLINSGPDELEVPGRQVVHAGQALMQRIFREFSYQSGSTTIHTTVEEVMQSREGVCQDFAHVMLGVLRSLGLSARYVSGYMLTEPPPGQPKLLGADASHAWVSLWCGADVGWVDFDPTNNQLPDTRYVTVAVGRDYADVPPMRGVVHGGGEHTLKVAVTVF